MKLLYCYVAFTDRNGKPNPLRGMSELELNFSTTNVYRYEKHPDSDIAVLRCSKRTTPLPEKFWANGNDSTNIYNVNVIAGVNGSGKSTAIQYLMDLLNYIYHGFGQTLDDRERYIRHDPSKNRNLLLFDTKEGLRILDLRQGKAGARLRLHGFHEFPVFLRLEEGVALLQSMKVINLNNTLTQRDHLLHSGKEERLRNHFIYDCTLGAAIGSEIGSYFSYEVYKQVAYLFEPRQAEARRILQNQIPDLRFPRAFRLRLLEGRFEKTITAISRLNDPEANNAYLRQASLPRRLALLCAASFLDNVIELTELDAHKLLGLPTIPKLAANADRDLFHSALIDFIGQAEEWLGDILLTGIVSGSDDRTLRVWDSAMRQCLHTLEGHTDWVDCVAILPEGRVVSGSDDHTLRVWDAATGQCLHTLEGHTECVTCVAVFPEGRVVSGSGDRTLRVWDAVTGQCLQTLDGHMDFVTCVVVLPEGKVISGSRDNTLRVWDVATGQCLQTLEGHTDWVNCVAILPEGRMVSGSDDHTLRVWDVATGQCLQTLEGHTDLVNCVAVLPGGRVVSGSDDNTLHVWDAATGQCLQTLEGHTAPVNCVAVLPEGRVVSGSRDSTLRTWDAATGHCLQTLEGHTSWVNCVTFFSDGRVVSGSVDNALRVWDAATGQCLQTLEGHTSWVTCVTVLPDGRFVSGSLDNTLRVWDDATGQCLQTLKEHGAPVTHEVVLPQSHAPNNTYEKLISDRAERCREYIDYILTDPERLLSRFTRSEKDFDLYELPLPQVQTPESDNLEKRLVKFLGLYHKICTPYYTLDFDWGLSSGEENLLRLFSWLFHIFPRVAEDGGYRYRIRNNPSDKYDGGTECDSILLFMDEADLTFHPEWQRRLIHILTVFLPTIYSENCGVKDMQLVLTTHSPLLLGDIPKENIHFLARSEDGSLRQADGLTETFGQNIHTILKDSFFLENGTIGQFAAAKINDAAKRLRELAELGEAKGNSVKTQQVDPPTSEELGKLRQIVALTAPGILRAGLEELLHRAEKAWIQKEQKQTELAQRIRQASWLTEEQRNQMLQALEMGGTSHD